MEKVRYIVKKRMREAGISGRADVYKRQRLEAVDGVIIHKGAAVCAVTSRNAHLHLARDDDGQGRERGALTLAITSTLEKRDKDHQARWDRVWEDETAQKYRRQDHEDHFLWGHAFFEAPVEDLRHIADLIGARR